MFSKTGTAIIEQLIAGTVDPVQLAGLAKGSLVRKKDELTKALRGRFSENHRFMTQMIMDTIKTHSLLIEKLEVQLEHAFKPFEMEMELLQTIPGVSRIAATGIISEIGVDMEQFKSAGHLASWAGVCPGNNESAGRKMSSRITQGNKYLKTTLIETAWASSHTLNSYLAFKYYSISKRRGKKKAAMAVGHEILKAAYYILRDKLPYREPKLRQEIIEQRRKAELERLEKRIQKLKTLASN